ncbi:MAG: histidine phosphatase family protein [Planctomycetaceae bacterium]|nr:MAG: histidine phosphatase family protein [Planctomycetaceae bacterium]
MSQVILIRPGCTDFDEQQRIQGGLDLPLSPKGREQMTRLLGELASQEFDIVYASPTEPSLGTARQLASARGVPVKCLDGLENVNQGLWQGLQLEELKRKHPKVYKQWQDSPACICPPGGESLSEAFERVRKALERPLRKKSRMAIVAADPLAGLIAAVVNGTAPALVSPICTGVCGTWVTLGAVKESDSSTEIPALVLAAARAT